MPSARSLANLKPFPKGVSGNPSGAKIISVEIRELARAHTHDALETLVSIARNKRAPAAARVSAASALLDRGFGRPQQELAVGVMGDPAERAEANAARLGQSGVTAIEALDAYRQLLEIDGDNASAREVIAAAATASRAREGVVIEGELAGEPQPATTSAAIGPTSPPMCNPAAIAAPESSNAPRCASLEADDSTMEPQELPPDVQAARDAWHAERARGER